MDYKNPLLPFYCHFTGIFRKQSMTVPQEFEQIVRDCLAHLYEFTALEHDPLAEQLTPQLDGLERVQVTRQIIVEAIEHLKKHKDSYRVSKQGRIYSILQMRYIEEHPTRTIIQRLALSERQYYRDHQRAIRALSHLLWNRIHQKNSATQSNITIKSEMALVSDHLVQEVVPINIFLSKIVDVTSNLASDYGVTVRVQPNSENPTLTVNILVLRQMMIWLLSHLIQHVPSGSVISLSYQPSSQILLDFEIETEKTKALHELFHYNRTLQQFIETLQLHLDYLPPAQLSIVLPTQTQPTVLVIDDNQDVVDLLQRYLSNTNLKIAKANHAKDGLLIAQSDHPALIILDVMLPDQDGWEVLQILKTHPRTQAIPVFVCSVLDSPELAYSLGADGYLLKPPNRIALLDMLSQWIR